ncbi:MAG: iron-sulfur cluster co-chaperone HscB C-terminal domain-containing protein [Phycisphaerales bacterium]
MHQDPFEALGLSRRFDLEARDIRRAWRARAADLHPDRVGALPGGADEGEIARRAALLNDAKRTLEDPERRADALLVLLGGPAREDEKSLPPAFLMEVMEIREDLEDAVGAADRERIASHEAWADTRRLALIDEVARAFAALADPPDGDALRDIRVTLNAWRYIERMREQIDAPETA